MSDEKMNDLWEDLKTQRDELRVRLHLAKADLKDEWKAVEDKWESAQDKFEEVLQGTETTAREVQGILRIIGEEIGQAYGRIKDRLDSEQQEDNR